MSRSTLIAFFGGIILTVAIFGTFAVMQRMNALTVAWNYPEVVSDLKVSKEFQVKK